MEDEGHRDPWIRAGAGRALVPALAGNTDQALTALRRAVDLGGWRERSLAHLRTDPDLVSLHDHPDWKAVVAAAQDRLDAYLRSLNPELRRMFDEDQTERAALKPGVPVVSELGLRDARRRERVERILDEGGAKVALRNARRPEGALLGAPARLRRVIRRSAVLVGLGSCAAFLAVATAGAQPAEEGLVVLDARPGFAAAQAGLRPGDRLRRWERGGAGGALRSAFALMTVELEQAPRGPVSLEVRRGENTWSLALRSDEWGLEVAPELPVDVLEAYQVARRAAEAGERARAITDLDRLAGRPDAQGEARSWLLAERARLHVEAGQPAPARSALEQAAREAGPPAVQARLWAMLGGAFRRARDLAGADAAWREALALDTAAAPAGLARLADVEQLAWVRHQLGSRPPDALAQVEQAVAEAERQAPRSLLLARLLDQVGRMARVSEAIAALRRALELKEQLAPDSLGLADTLHQLSFRGADAEALAYARRSLSIRERWAPDSSLVAASLLLVSQALATHGDLAGAVAHDRRALEIRERLEPGSYTVSNALVTASINAAALGDLEQAEQSIRRAIAIEEKIRPGSIHHAIVLFNLGALLRQRRDLEAADDVFEEAGRIAETQSPEGNLLPRIVMSRGAVAAERGALDEAEEQLRRAVTLFRTAGPVTLGGAQEELARVLGRRGKRQEAEALVRQALLALAAGQSPPIVAGLQGVLGDLLASRGDLAGAEAQHRAALAVHREIAPGSVRHAEASHALGVVVGRLGRKDEALSLLREAVTALEEQGRRLGGSVETRARFRSHHQQLYRSLEEALLDAGRPQEAFEVVERSRARSLLAALASRDLDFSRDVPPALEDERRRLDAEHGRALAGLGDPSLDGAGRAEARQRLEELRRRQQDVRARIRASAPRLAALRDPEPLDLEGVSRVLAEGTLLLVYSLGATASRVYAVGPDDDGLQVAPIPASEAELREDVRRFRELVAARRSPQLQGGLDAISRRLGRRLLGPVGARLKRAERLLVVPDGALHLLPFAALADPGKPGRRFLVESMPVSRVSSLTLFASLAAAGGKARHSGDVVGFGDPVYRPSPDGPAGALSGPRAVLRGGGLEPLPWTRGEIESLEAIAPGAARLYLGREATEERARALPREARVVHFACHGVLDEALPLESGLALSMPEPPAQAEANGLLQAWEVLESLRLDAELVTLSACQTGLGGELAGEGLIGLVWAFQYAGARSVVASLWEVSDASTAELMRRFYHHLGTGLPKAEALRRAQVQLLRRRATSPPWFWAAFTLVGDGR